MNIDGVNYLFVKKNGLLFGATTRWNASPSQIIELLNRFVKVFKDYCGVLSEEAIRKNFILIYELLDEMLDYGYPQVSGRVLVCVLPWSSNTLQEAQSSRDAQAAPFAHVVTQLQFI